MKISKLKLNPENPRVIKDEQFLRLVDSISGFPEMMIKRPMVCVTDPSDKKLFPLGGNQRLKAILHLNYKEIPDEWVMLADDWTDQQRKEFVVRDNVSFGEWDVTELLNGWEKQTLIDMGVEANFYMGQDIDLDAFFNDDEGKGTLSSPSEMTNEVRKAIQIDFDYADYEGATKLVSECRKRDIYIGGELIKCLTTIIEQHESNRLD